MGLRLLTLGVGDAFSTTAYSTCFALEAEGVWILVDCPHPILKMLREAGAAAGRAVPADRISAVVLTHLHADHCSGLETFGFYCRFKLQRRLPILAHPSVISGLWPNHLAAGMQWAAQGPGQAPIERRFEDFFQWIPLEETQPVSVGPFAVRCRPTIHSVPTTALTFEAGGRRLGYSSDTAFDPSLIDWLSSSDMILHEATPGFLHTPCESLDTLPAAIRQKMRLVHFDDGFDPSRHNIAAMQQGTCCEV